VSRAGRCDRPRRRNRAPSRTVTTSPYRGSVDHYANCFTLMSQRCFRMIQAEDGTDHAQHCPRLTEWRGRFKDAASKWHTVEACNGHRADLDAVQRVT
jgi:hypothetical protein